MVQVASCEIRRVRANRGAGSHRWLSHTHTVSSSTLSEAPFFSLLCRALYCLLRPPPTAPLPTWWTHAHSRCLLCFYTSQGSLLARRPPPAAPPSTWWTAAWTCCPHSYSPRPTHTQTHSLCPIVFFCACLQGSLLDAEAASRCTTVYLVDRRLDMLPALLSEQLCSLRGGQDRLAMSCVWVLREADLGVESVWCGRTLIRWARVCVCLCLCARTVCVCYEWWWSWWWLVHGCLREADLGVESASCGRTLIRWAWARAVVKLVVAKGAQLECQQACAHFLTDIPCPARNIPRRSRYQLEYQQAQDVMDDRPPRPGHEIAPADRPTLQVGLGGWWWWWGGEGAVWGGQVLEGLGGRCRGWPLHPLVISSLLFDILWGVT